MKKDAKPETSLALFQEKTVRRQWYKGRWFFSIIDVVSILTDSERPRSNAAPHHPFWQDVAWQHRMNAYILGQ